MTRGVEADILGVWCCRVVLVVMCSCLRSRELTTADDGMGLMLPPFLQL